MMGRAARAFSLVAVLAGVATGAAAQDPTILPPMMDKAPVVLDGRKLFEVGESGTWSPAQRAAEINRILRAAAADPEPVNLVLAEHDGYPTIRMGEWHLLTVTDSDVLPGMEAGEQAQRWLQTIEAALLRAREQRSAAYVAGAALRGAAVLLLAAGLHWLLSRARRRLPLRLAHWRALPAHSAIGGKPAWQLAVELLCGALQALLWIGALLYAVEQFPLTRQARFDTARVLGDSLRAPLFTANERAYSTGDFLWLAAAVALLWIAVSLVTRLVSMRLMRATGASHGALQPVATLVRYGLIFIGVIVILQVAGLNLSSLALLASVLGVGIGFGLQSIANNFVSGIILSFEQPVKPGDFVSLGSLQGTVLRIGGRSTVIRTIDRVSIIVPNSQLLEQQLVNWSYGDELARLHVPVGVAYGSDIDGVRSALLEAAKSHPAVLADPHPDVRLVGFGDSALNFELLVWTKDPPGHVLLESDLCYAIERNLRRAGIEIPFPQRTLHVAAAEVESIMDRLQDARAAAPVALYDSSGAPTRPHHAEPSRGPSSGDGHGAPVDTARALDVDTLIARMRGPGGLVIQDRRHLLSVYAKCFVGSEAVEWLMRANSVSRDEAIHLGQSLVERGVFHHVLDEHPFRDGNFFYRFYADE
jgi:potassium-dependent mechanosensitive channel